MRSVTRTHRPGTEVYTVTLNVPDPSTLIAMTLDTKCALTGLLHLAACVFSFLCVNTACVCCTYGVWVWCTCVSVRMCVHICVCERACMRAYMWRQRILWLPFCTCHPPGFIETRHLPGLELAK